MTLLEFYTELCKNDSFFYYYFSTSGKCGGKVFSFINTNYRGILTKSKGELQGFAKGFRVLENVEGIPRSSWVRHAGKQETEKQHVVNMRKAEFFRVVDDRYQKTSRGIVFKKMVIDTTLTDIEKKLLCLLMLLSGYFSDTPNYIVEQTKLFFRYCNEAGYSDSEILQYQKEFVDYSKSSTNNLELFEQEYIFIDSFYQPFGDIFFLKNYKEASTLEKEELSKYVARHHQAKRKDCILAKKFESGGNYTKTTVTDNAWILYVTKKVIDANPARFEDFIRVLIDSYGELYSVNKNSLNAFIYNTDKNRSVLQVIYSKVMNVAISPLSVEKDLTEDELKELSFSDSTDEGGLQALDLVSSSLKKLAKLNAGYKCVLDSCEMCKYFTAKENNQNYLEIHHFIPREFANDFDYPIEILDNYVALCPNCHRKIHLAVDAERKHMINIIYGARESGLAKHGLRVDIKTLYQYYKIDS